MSDSSYIGETDDIGDLMTEISWTRDWQHLHDDTLQAVEPLGWTQHHCIVLALEEGWVPMGEPVYVRLSEMRLVTE